MHSAELEPLSDKENLDSPRNSTNMQKENSNLLKKITSPNRKKLSNDNLNESLINPNEHRTSSSHHQIIEVNDNNQLLTTNTNNNINNNDSLHHHELNNDDINMDIMTQSQYDNIVMNDDSLVFTNDNMGESKSCFNHFLHSLCSCYQNGKLIESFKGHNLYCCARHIITGPPSQYMTLFLTVLLIGGPLYGFYWMIHKLYITQNNDYVSYIIIMFISLPLTFSSLYFLFKTNFTDPGIIPRASKTEPMYGPLNQYDRFCSTCYVVRPAKAKHCSLCGNCVLGFDHHCPWVGTCIGERNLRYFVGFVGMTGIHALEIGIICLINLFVGKIKIGTSLGLVDVVVLIYTAIISCMLIGMSGDYFFMIGNGLTLNEKIKYGHRVITEAEKKKEQKQEKRKKFRRNINYAFCKPLPNSSVFE